MIQHISPRKTASASAPLRAPADGLEQWGKWVGRNYYALEMVQHPLRARMCGFGDKDRRPLAPAAVARMVVKRDDHSLVDVDDVDCSFFLVTVDLWSEDGRHERNLVLHPSSGDRYVPVQAPATKQRRRGSAPGPPRSGQQTPISRATPTPAQYRPGEPSPLAPLAPNAFPPPSSVSVSASSPYGSAPPTWGYPAPHPPDRTTGYPPPILPSIHAFGRASPGPGPDWAPEPEPTYRPWTADGSPPGTGFGAPDGQPREWEQQGQGQGQRGYGGHAHDSAYAGSPPPPPPLAPLPVSAPSYDPALYAPAPYAQHPQAFFTPPPSYSSPVSGHAYTRTLVGPLSSNGYRLLDEHRKPGIFFLFQDLSVRTEGTFRLRLRLMNVGAPPAPEPGALQVHTTVSPVLAQIFSEPFTVYSAKRFPGVPETTALSIAFGNQGLKLPLVRCFPVPVPSSVALTLPLPASPSATATARASGGGTTRARTTTPTREPGARPRRDRRRTDGRA
ncbi:velvet factor [Mycena belliarum]|uniref:Velvet factor n=1 Tax=Mycena belliarum TaxID=1033014 RepID=A0AAD6U7T5_9AGAR|nr:velvet factor [Mycena belliae]